MAYSFCFGKRVLKSTINERYMLYFVKEKVTMVEFNQFVRIGESQ